MTDIDNDDFLKGYKIQDGGIWIPRKALEMERSLCSTIFDIKNNGIIQASTMGIDSFCKRLIRLIDGEQEKKKNDWQH